jgi:hypothetical protein
LRGMLLKICRLSMVIKVYTMLKKILQRKSV